MSSFLYILLCVFVTYIISTGFVAVHRMLYTCPYRLSTDKKKGHLIGSLSSLRFTSISTYGRGNLEYTLPYPDPNISLDHTCHIQSMS